MRNRGLKTGLLLATSALACSSNAGASETIVYRYDSLGRLVRVERSGTVNIGVSAAYAYDSADNRTNVTVTAAAPSPPLPPPPPPPPPPPSNRRPVPVPESFSIARCVVGSFNVIANDSDPDGDYPLVLTEVMGSAVSLGYASVAGATSIAWAKAAKPGDYPLIYTVRDSRGATASMQVVVTVTGTGTSPCS
ncbi:MAG TPA: Ig-like domain-containing protein [Allosphingosinicella sp.]|nr:Ig-like domain-containing protein [Allosphingosinicella sp.]